MFILTPTNSKIRFDAIEESTIRFEDIANSLNLARRYNGQVDLSIATHSIWVYRFVALNIENMLKDKAVDLSSLNGVERDQVMRYIYLSALLHDAHEAYTGDIVTPLKVYIKQAADGKDIIRELEEKFDAVIMNALIPRNARTTFDNVTENIEGLAEVVIDAIKIADRIAYAYERVVYLPPHPEASFLKFLESIESYYIDNFKLPYLWRPTPETDAFTETYKKIVNSISCKVPSYLGHTRINVRNVLEYDTFCACSTKIIAHRELNWED